MKKLLLLSAALFSIIAISSCEKEIAGPDGLRTVISVTAASTKTALGEKEGTSWPNYWKTGDQICVNGLVSEALGSDADGKDKADFSFESALAVPYYAAYPVSAVSGYSAGSATLSVPASQNYVAGSYDPAAFVMYGKSDTEGTVELEPLVSVIHLKLTGSASISKVKLTCAADAALSGSFTTDFTSCTKATVSNEVEMVAATAVDLPADFFICVPAGLSGQLQVDIFDSASGSMSKTATLKSALAAGQMYLAPELPYVASAPSALTITAEGITSSTAVICVTGDTADAYTFNVYSDAACSTLVDSYAVDAGNSCWGSASPRFCISGLTASTPYYVKVTDVTSGAESDALTVTTAAFQLVQPGSTAAAAGDVLLAEDFGELRWDSDVIGNGVGYFPTSLDSFANTEVSSFQAAATSNEKQISAQATALAASRLAHWAQGANPHMYIHPGYIKLVGNSKVTHLVTPALDNIPDGMVATLEVKVTASAYYSESSGSFATTSAIVAVQTASGINEFGDDPNTNTLDLTTNVAPITLKEESAWNEYTVTLTSVGKGARLAFGAAPDVTNNNARMNISDITVTLKSLEAPSLTASVKSVSSSTAAFTWTYGGSAAADIARPYTISLYSNSACTDLVISHDIDADASCWSGKTPCFVFGGLAPDTEYWFVASDTSTGTTSAAVSAKTSAFTVVDVTTLTNASVGDVILAEDFSEIAHGPDELAGAAGFVPSAHILLPAPSGVNPEGVFVDTGNTGNRVFGSGWNISGSRMEKGWGFFGNSSCFSRNGYLRVSSSSGRTHIVTPVLSCIPAGKVATLEVTVTAGKYESSSNDVAVFVEKDLTMNSQTSPSEASYRKYTGASLADAHALGITSAKEWETKTVTISKVDSECQLVIGSLNADKTRFFLDDVVVTVVGLKDQGAIDAVMEISDFITFKSFLTACEPGKTIQGNVTADIALTSAQVEEINALYPVAEFEGIINGNNHTISGLAKPLFAKFTGKVSDLTLNSTLNITEAMNDVGILAQSATDATLTNCISMGSVTSAASEVSGDLALGGLVGSISGCTLVACQNQAAVTNNTTASGTACIGGLVGVADGANTLTGTASEYNLNKGVIADDSGTLDVAIGGICGYSFGAASDFAYARSLAPDGEDVDDIEIRNNTKNKVYVGGIIGKSAVTSSMDYTYNSSDIKFTNLKITQTGQVFGGGIIGGWTASGEQTITGCENKGWVYTKASAGDLAAADSDALPKYWSCFAGIAGMGAGTSESLGSSWYTITGKTFTNCTNTGTVRIYAALRCCIAGVVAYTENNPDGCVSTAADIRPFLTGGIAKVGDNYHRNICGGVVGLCTASKVSNLKSTAKIVSQSSSPFAYTGGILGYVPAGSIELENCKVSNHVQAAGSGDGRSALMCHVAQNAVTVTFTNCVVKNGTISYSTGKKVTISSSNLSALHCVGPGSKYSITNDVLPTVESSI